MTSTVLIFLFALSFGWLIWRPFRRQKPISSLLNEPNEVIVGFFHPFCADGGGGERVLWCFLSSLAESFPHLKFMIYSKPIGQESHSNEIIQKAGKVFELNLSNLESRLTFIEIRSFKLLLPQNYPRLTLLLQSLGSMIVALECIHRKNCNIFIDTTGFAFTLPVIKIFNPNVATVSYVHYPTISSDMLNVVTSGTSQFNNQGLVAKWKVLKALKVKYYQVFSKLYQMAGSCSDVTITNSSWTKNHIDEMWNIKSELIFPPCKVNQKEHIALKTEKESCILSLGQFRPEKNHKMQIEIFAKVLEKFDAQLEECPKLILVGGCRNEDDFKRVQDLKDFVALKLRKRKDLVSFTLNASTKELNELLGKSMIGLHTMKDEHFGIAPVEIQSHGVIIVAHNSGGPKLDIVQHGESGFLAESVDDFAEKIFQVATISDDIRSKIREQAFKTSKRFTEEVFKEKVTELFNFNFNKK